MDVSTIMKNDSSKVAFRAGIMLSVSILVGLLAWMVELQQSQIISCSIFIMIIMATLLFWKFRLAIAFIGIGVLMCSSVLDLPTFIRECKLDVILFLVGMMVTVGVLITRKQRQSGIRRMSHLGRRTNGSNTIVANNPLQNASSGPEVPRPQASKSKYPALTITPQELQSNAAATTHSRPLSLLPEGGLLPERVKDVLSGGFIRRSSVVGRRRSPSQ